MAQTSRNWVVIYRKWTRSSNEKKDTSSSSSSDESDNEGICFYLLSTIVSYYFYQWVPGGWGMMGLLSSPLEFKYNLKVGKLMQIIKLREHKVEQLEVNS